MRIIIEHSCKDDSFEEIVSKLQVLLERDAKIKIQMPFLVLSRNKKNFQEAYYKSDGEEYVISLDFECDEDDLKKLYSRFEACLDDFESFRIINILRQDMISGKPYSLFSRYGKIRNEALYRLHFGEGCEAYEPDWKKHIEDLTYPTENLKSV